MDQLEDDEGPRIGPATGEAETMMTAEATEDTDEGVREDIPPFYATRTIHVTGDLLLGELPIDLATEQGDIRVETGTEDAYELHVELTGYGNTPQDAEDQRDRLTLTWTTGEPEDHRLFAHVEQDDEDGASDRVDGHAEGTITLTVPSTLWAHLSAASSTGAVTLEDVQALTAHAATSTGDIQGDVHGTRTASFESSTGDIDATVTPRGSGSISLTTSTGEINIGVPETSQHGYQAQAATSTGDIDIQLQDGQTQQQGGAGGQQVAFLTDGFTSRAVQTSLNLATSTADITLHPS